MCRYKTPHRIVIETFLDDTSKTRDDWLGVPYANKSERSKYYSTAYQLKRHGYPIAILEQDSANKIIWIRRAN